MDKEENIKLSIVTVTWNSARDIGACLDAVYASTLDSPIEYFVVDNGSSDETAVIIKHHYPQVNLIVNQTNNGYAAANNQALRQAKGRYLLLLNPDTVVQARALNEMITYLDEHPHVGMVGPRLVRPDGSLQRSCTRFASVGATGAGFISRGGYLPRDRERATPVQGLSGAALMVRGETLTAVGLLDEDYFMYGEDTDWCYRVQQAGWEVHYLPTAEVLHLGGQSARQVPAHTYVRRRAAKLLFVEKHRAAWQKFVLKYALYAHIQLRKLLSSGPKRQYYGQVLQLYSQVMHRDGKNLYSL